MTRDGAASASYAHVHALVDAGVEIPEGHTPETIATLTAEDMTRGVLGDPLHRDAILSKIRYRHAASVEAAGMSTDGLPARLAQAETQRDMLSRRLASMSKQTTATIQALTARAEAAEAQLHERPMG